MPARKMRGSAILAALIVIGVLAVVTAVTLTLANISKGDSARDAQHSERRDERHDSQARDRQPIHHANEPP